MFVIRIIQLTIAFNHSYHTCKFDIDWISILLKISKINANFHIIAISLNLRRNQHTIINHCEHPSSIIVYVTSRCRDFEIFVFDLELQGHIRILRPLL